MVERKRASEAVRPVRTPAIPRFQINMWVDQEYRDRMNEAAAAEGKSRVGWIRDTIQAALDRRAEENERD